MLKNRVQLAGDYKGLLSSIGRILAEGRKQAFYAVNAVLVKTYWEIGRQIVEYEQRGREKADYGSKLLEQLSDDLKARHGRGFNLRNIYLMRKFYLSFRNLQTVSAELSWSHFVELLEVDDPLAREFYNKQCVKEHWSVRELKRQVNSMLFHRIALSKDKKGVLELAKRGQKIEVAADLVKDPYVLEFLGIPQNFAYSEKKLEQKIIDNLQVFLLELGKGFAFVGRQYRISFGGAHFYIDLVFYNRILKCFVLIDLKIGEANHLDIGQMNLYLNYFKKEEMVKGDNEPIGIILSAKKNHALVEFSLGSISNKMFVSKYKLYLPEKKQLEKELRRLLE